MKWVKSLFDKLQANTWVYWFVGVFTILYTSQSIHDKTVNEILFAHWAPVADKVCVWAFVVMMGYFLIKWANKKKK